jgi:predicted DNA-binding transcriptional regulator YafY
MVKYHDNEGELVERRLHVIDLFSKDKAEFLNATDQSTGERFTLRLDRIGQITDGDKTYIVDRC